MPNHVVWTATHQEAFEAMKKGLCVHVIEYGQPCGILTDASEKSVGCCLVQWDASGAEKPIAFASAKLSFTQMRWSTIEREAYAVIFTLRKFRNFVFLPLPLRSRPLKIQLGGLGSAVSSPSGLWGGAPVDKRFGAF